MAASSVISSIKKSQNKSNLNKKCPANPRYRHVKPIVDSGENMRKYAETIEEQHRHFKIGKEEIFRRIKLESLVTLIIEVGYNVLQQTEGKYIVKKDASSEISLKNMVASIIGPAGDVGPCPPNEKYLTSRSTLHSVISGIGELDLTANLENQRLIDNTNKLIEAPITIPKPYLLLDVRDSDSYNQSHVISAVNYPHTMISRSINYETKDLLAFKNSSGRIIVIYDDDETYSQKVATTLVQRGYENIYLLSGGLKLALQKFDGDVFVTNPEQMKFEFTVDDLEKLQKSIDFHLQMSTVPGSSRRPSTFKDYKMAIEPGRRRAEDQARASSVTSSSTSLSRKPWK